MNHPSNARAQQLYNGHTPEPAKPPAGHAPVGFVNESLPLLLTKKEGAQLVNISVRTIDRLLDADWMPELVEVLGCKRFRRAELELWVASGCPKDWRAAVRPQQYNIR